MPPEYVVGSGARVATGELSSAADTYKKASGAIAFSEGTNNERCRRVAAPLRGRRGRRSAARGGVV